MHSLLVRGIGSREKLQTYHGDQDDPIHEKINLILLAGCSIPGVISLHRNKGNDMKVKTNGLVGSALDWAVARCEHTVKRHKYGSPVFNPKTKRVYETQGLEQIGVNFTPSTDWAQGGPIIEREDIDLMGVWDNRELSPDVYSLERLHFTAGMDFSALFGHVYTYRQDGPTKLVAAMRCYVESKFGDIVEIPDELI